MTMTPKKKPLRVLYGDDINRAGWYASDGEWFCVCCDTRYGYDGAKIPKGAAVFHTGIGGLMYCLKHAPGDAVHAPAHTEGAS